MYNWFNEMSGRRWWWAVSAISAVLGVTIPSILLVPIVASEVFCFGPIGYTDYNFTNHIGSLYLEAWSFITIPLPGFNSDRLFLFTLFLIPVTIFCLWLVPISFGLARNRRMYKVENEDWVFFPHRRVWRENRR